MINRFQSITNLAEALAKAQGEMPAAEMNATNPFLKNKYADLGSIIKTAQPILKKYGLSLAQMPTSDNGNVGLTTILMHESGEWIESTIYLPIGDEKGKSLAQVAGSVITYLRRYAYAATLGMYADEDTDGHLPAQKAQPKQERVPTIYQQVVDMGLAENVHAAKNALAKRDKSIRTEPEGIAWMKLYRKNRDLGMQSDEAATQANNEVTAG